MMLLVFVILGLLLVGYCWFAAWVIWQLSDWQHEVDALGRRWEGWKR